MKGAVLLLLCCSCAAGTQLRRERVVEAPDIDAVLDAARAHLGRSTVRVRGRAFATDCSNFVRGMFWATGIDLMSEGSGNDRNGVRAIFRYVERHGQIHFDKVPQKGDLVYFDNTWDMNGNGRLDDRLTHVGIVEQVGEGGTLQIIHSSNHGIVREPMNLLRPHDASVNAALRPKGLRDPAATPHLMAELFAGFGTVVQRTRTARR
jgi:cell wall-associated NlpC family hydrolase